MFSCLKKRPSVSEDPNNFSDEIVKMKAFNTARYAGDMYGFISCDGFPTYTMDHLGDITIDYYTLTRFFGNPTHLKKHKNIDWIWYIMYNNDKITISNWENGPNFFNKDDNTIVPNYIHHWRVCGTNKKILEELILILL